MLTAETASTTAFTLAAGWLVLARIIIVALCVVFALDLSVWALSITTRLFDIFTSRISKT